MPRQSPSQTVGPFFHYGLIFGGENILVNEQTAGQWIALTGHVFDGDGLPVPDALIEIWQADAQGFFNHPNDPNQAKSDLNFRGFGRSDTVAGGQFYFKTIKPGIIPGSHTPYVNMYIFSRGMLIHAHTRLYFADEPGNADDPVLNSVPAERRATLIARQQETGDIPTYRFDIHLQGEAETVFFNP